MKIGDNRVEQTGARPLKPWATREADLKRTILAYALALVAAAFSLQWLEYRYALHRLPTTALVGVIATAFVVLGVWVGWRLAPRQRADAFKVNEAAMTSLGISTREYTVLTLLAGGKTNKEIARELSISPNTVKSHVAHLYDKLSVSRRTEAVNRARELGLIG